MPIAQVILAALFERLAVGVLVLDDDLHVLFINAAAENTLAKSQGQLLGRSVFKAFLSRPELFDSLNELDAGDIQVFRQQEWLLSDMQEVICDCVVTGLGRDSGFNFDQGYLVEIQAIERQQNISREYHFQEQQQGINRLAANLAHEVKNPLGGIRGAAQLLEGELSDDTDLREYTAIILAEVDRLSGLVDQILGKSNLTAKLQPVNIHEVLEQVIKICQLQAPKTIRWVRDYDPSLPEFQAVPDQMIQVGMNLVNNALAAVDPNDGVLQFKTRIMRYFTLLGKTHRLVLRVDIIDNGRGVPEDIKNHLFIPMVSGSSIGSGLGLAIAQTIMLQFGGMVDFSSSPGHTVFSLLIPIESAHE